LVKLAHELAVSTFHSVFLSIVPYLTFFYRTRKTSR